MNNEKRINKKCVDMSDLYQKLIELCDNPSTQLISTLGFYSEMYIGFNYYPMICHTYY